MAVRSREYVGIAEGIKSHEISTKRRIENLNNTINELSSYKNSLEWEISSLEAQIDAARSQTDEEGNPDPDYGLIAQLESQKRQVESDLKKTEDDLDKAHGELREATDEFEQVMEEKERTLFEIQERARNTSANISKAGSMFGAYSGVGTNLQSAFQASFDSLSQAANILDGSVGGVGGGYGGRGSASGGRSNGGSGSLGYNDTSTSPLSAFMKNANGDGSYVPSPSDFHSEQSGRLTPATSNNFNYGNGNLGSAKLINYSSTQSANSYATVAFSYEYTNNNSEHSSKYNSSQVTANVNDNFPANSTKMFPSNFENTDLRKQSILDESENWKSSLSADEAQAVKDYTNWYHKNINDKLRGKTLFFDKGNKERSEHIHNALQKTKIPCPCTVYRGTTIEALGKYKHLPDKDLVGKVLLDKGFMSTSIDPKCAFSGIVRLEILVPEGKHAAYVSNGTSAVGDSEKEVLFDKGQRLKIIGIKYDDFGNRTIQARMM